MKIFRKILLLLPIIFLFNCSLFWTPESVKLNNPEQTVKDARQVIEQYRAKIINQFGENTKDTNSFFEADKKGGKYHEHVENLPESLKIEGLRYALVCYDHIDLVFSRNPDFELGLRIWSSDAKQPHEDQPTKYTEIYSGYYNNDSPISASNIP
jgi:hypothetical protein